MVIACGCGWGGMRTIISHLIPVGTSATGRSLTLFLPPLGPLGPLGVCPWAPSFDSDLFMALVETMCPDH
jgi:hypothetical protein